MRKLNIFIVDDDRDFVDSLSGLFSHHGNHTFSYAYDGKKAIEVFRDNSFDITFLDVKLPLKNGVDVLIQMKHHNPNAKVVLMTAYNMNDLLYKGLKNGAMKIIHKPFNVPDLFNILDSV